MKITYLNEFYSLMRATRELRAQLVEEIIVGNTVPADARIRLQNALSDLTAIPHTDNTYKLLLDKNKTISIDLTYEIEELKKDLYFIQHDETEFYNYLAERHPHFTDEVSAGTALLDGLFFNAFITDRDGTVNNYCGRYASSVQSMYNAVFLGNFARIKTTNSIILTSAPLQNIGLIDISVGPINTFIYAASKGREYIGKDGIRNSFPIPQEKQTMLDRLNKRLEEMIKSPLYEKFSLIGSGLQFKFGQTTIARQDINNSIPEQESEAFLHLMRDLTNELDPEHIFFRIEDTGKDIEIILTVDHESNSHEATDFDKGNGVAFLNEALGLNLSKGTLLICGDTPSDLPMVSTAMHYNHNTYAIFVTTDDSLKKTVHNICPNSLIVSNPDVLITILQKLSQ